MSTLTEEAQILIQQQPESNVRIIVELLKKLTPQKKTSTSTQHILRRTGKANGKIVLPVDFDEHFDDLNDEIAQDFSEGSL